MGDTPPFGPVEWSWYEAQNHPFIRASCQNYWIYSKIIKFFKNLLLYISNDLFFFAQVFVSISCRNFFQPHILMFSCLYTFLRSHGSTFSWFLCLHMFSRSLVPTHVLLFSRLYMFSCSLGSTCPRVPSPPPFLVSIVSTCSRALLFLLRTLVLSYHMFIFCVIKN